MYYSNNERNPIIDNLFNDGKSYDDIVIMIRKELKEKGISSRRVSVRNSRAVFDTYIDIRIKDLSIKISDVEEITNKYEYIRYDDYAQEILQGCNVFINVEYDYQKVSEFQEQHQEYIQNLYDKTYKKWIDEGSSRGQVLKVMGNDTYTICISFYDEQVYILKENENPFFLERVRTLRGSSVYELMNIYTYFRLDIGQIENT